MTDREDKGLVDRLRGLSANATTDEAIARITALEAENARLTKVAEHAKRMSEALTLVRPLGGSELFVKVGDEYYADPLYCGGAINKLKDDLHNAKVKAVADDRELATTRQDLEQAQEALRHALAYLEGSNPLHLSGCHRNTDLRDEIRAALGESR